MRNLDHKSFVFSIHLSARPQTGTFSAFCFISLGLSECVLQREGLGQAQTRCVGGSAPAELPSTAATADHSWSISVQELQIVPVPAPSPSAETHQPQTRGSWQCLKFIIFSHGKQLTRKPTYRAWACCCCCSTWMLNWAFNWFPQPVFQV